MYHYFGNGNFGITYGVINCYCQEPTLALMAAASRAFFARIQRTAGNSFKLFGYVAGIGFHYSTAFVTGAQRYRVVKMLVVRQEVFFNVIEFKVDLV